MRAEFIDAYQEEPQCLYLSGATMMVSFSFFYNTSPNYESVSSVTDFIYQNVPKISVKHKSDYISRKSTNSVLP